MLDIQELVTTKGDWFTGEISQTFGHEVADRLSRQFAKQETNSLRLSQMGPRCPCALWHSIHSPAAAERLPPWAEVKYAFGHVIEALAIALAKAAGHEVTGEQDEVSVDGIRGHRDCIIDGCVVDVKSCSSYQFQKYKDRRILVADDFGYLDQLDGYVVGSKDDPLVRCKDKGYILAIDKTLGHMNLYEHIVREQSIHERIALHKRCIEQLSPPRCTCDVVEHGKSGNLKLDVKASYNLYKYCCNPNLRTFLYSDGPVYLVHVERKPDVTEIDKFGNVVYN